MSRFTVSPEDVKAFYRDGAICLRGVLSPSDVAEVRERCIARVPAAGDPSTPYKERMNLATQVENFWSLCEALPAIAAQLMDSQVVRYYNDHFFVKDPGLTARSDFHQDGTFWPFTGDMVSTWVGMSSVDAESSPLVYVPGSHRWGKFYRPGGVGAGRDPEAAELERCPDYFDPEVAKDVELLSWETGPGDVLVHHPFMIHGAPRNRSAKGISRVALTVRFLGEGVRWQPRSYTPLPAVVPNVEAGEYPGDDAAFPVVWDNGPVAGLAYSS